MVDIHKILTQGATFKRGKDESQSGKQSKFRPKKPKGKTISGASKMRAAYKAKIAAKCRPKTATTSEGNVSVKIDLDK